MLLLCLAMEVAPSAPGWWVSGRKGAPSPWSQAQVFALCKVPAKLGVPYTDPELALEVSKVCGGHPTKEAIRLLRNKFEEDADWYPGKASMDSQQPGRPKVMTPAQENAIAPSAMAMKVRGMEPSVGMVIAHCPKATLNPGTNGPFLPR